MGVSVPQLGPSALRGHEPRGQAELRQPCMDSDQRQLFQAERECLFLPLIQKMPLIHTS